MSKTRKRKIRNALLPQGIVFAVILAFVTICAVLRNVNLLVVVSGSMSAVLLMCWRSSRRILRNVIARRIPPPEIFANVPSPIQWQTINQSGISVFNLRIEDQIKRMESQSLGSAENSVQSRRSTGVLLIEGILPGEDSVASYQATFSQRGVYRAGPAIVSSQFPLPLVKCWFRTEQQTEIYVAPPLGNLLSGWQSRIIQLETGFDSQSPCRGTIEEEFFAIRNFNSGDSLKHIHWRSTAKTGSPMVRQFESHAPDSLLIAVDLFRFEDRISDSLDPESEHQICETMLSMLATILQNWRQNIFQKLVVGIADQTATVHVANPDTEFASQLHRRLASCNACQNTAIDELIQKCLAENPTNRTLMVLSSRSIPEEIREQFSTERLQWIQCNREQLKNLFQEKSVRKTWRENE